MTNNYERGIHSTMFAKLTKRILSLVLIACLLLSLCACFGLSSLFEDDYYDYFKDPEKPNTEEEDIAETTDTMSGEGRIFAKGIDVSKWQADNVDFNEVKNAGYDFVIIRCGSSKGKDDCFEQFYTEAKEAGLDVGTYYYSYAVTAEEAATDAANCLSFIEGKQFEYPIYFDFEDISQITLDVTLCANICNTFLRRIRSAGYLPGLYSMASVMEKKWI